MLNHGLVLQCDMYGSYMIEGHLVRAHVCILTCSTTLVYFLSLMIYTFLNYV